jgi:hypothetical protein
MPRPEFGLQGLDVETGGGALFDRALGFVHAQNELSVVRPRLAQLDLRARHQPFVVVPVQERAVVLGEAHDLGTRTGGEVVERLELAILPLLEVRVDRPAVRAAVRSAETLSDALDHLVGERVAKQVGLLVGFRGCVSHEVR